MINLANSSSGQLFTVPADDWTAINTRVGVVMAVSQIQIDVSQYLPGYPSLLASSQLWKSNTFNGLIGYSKSLADYASIAIADFSSLDQSVKSIAAQGVSMPDDVKRQTTALLQKLAGDTAAMGTISNTLSGQILQFLNDNRIVDAQIAEHKDALNFLWPSIEAAIALIENSAGLVAGEWKAISDDLSDVLSSDIDITIPFVESLNIDAAVISWQSLQTEASAFPSMAAGQEKYWTLPVWNQNE